MRNECENEISVIKIILYKVKKNRCMIICIIYNFIYIFLTNTLLLIPICSLITLPTPILFMLINLHRHLTIELTLTPG